MPTFRRLAAFISRLLPERLKRSKGARLARRNPGLTAWLVVFTGAGMMIAAQETGDPRPDRNPARYRAWLQERGERAVRASVAEIGLSRLVVPTVRAQPDRDWVAGTFSPWNGTIAFNSKHEFSDAYLLSVAAHESVHALFDQHGLRPNTGRHADFHLLVEETAAEVLGAYIAGDAWSRDGGDGLALTAQLLEDHRRACSPTYPNSVYNKYLAPGRNSSEGVDRERWQSALVHYGPLQLVNAIDETCRWKTDRVAAAKAIARRFLRAELLPVDRPILEEFEQTRKRGMKL